MVGGYTKVLAAALLISLLAAPRAQAQHVSLWGGGGLGTFLTGGSGAGDVNASRIAMLAVTLPGDDVELRVLKGTLERPRGIPTQVGDDDFDYKGFDAVVTGKLTGLPVDLAAGVVRYEEAYHRGYPNADLGGRILVHRWGPHVSALRSFRVLRYGEVWTETDLRYAPYRPRQLLLFLNVGIGLRL